MMPLFQTVFARAGEPGVKYDAEGTGFGWKTERSTEGQGQRASAGLRTIGKLTLQGEADQESVQRFLAAIEILDAMIASQLFDAERHRLLGRFFLLEYARFGQEPPEPWQQSGRCIQGGQKRLPLHGIEPEMLPVRQCFLGACERALQYELADRAP